MVHSVNTIPKLAVLPDVHNLRDNFTLGVKHKKVVKSDFGNWYLHIDNGYVLFTQSEFERSTLKQVRLSATNMF